MGCQSSSQTSLSLPPVYFPKEDAKLNNHIQPSSIKQNSSVGINDAQIMQNKDQQSQQMALILKQLSLQNEMILQLKKQNTQQQFELQRSIQKVTKEKRELEKREQQRRKIQNSKINIQQKFQNIGKSVAQQCPVICGNCTQYFPKFIDYCPGLKKCICMGTGVSYMQHNRLKCTHCGVIKDYTYKVDVCMKCYGYGVLNQ